MNRNDLSCALKSRLYEMSVEIKPPWRWSTGVASKPVCPSVDRKFPSRTMVNHVGERMLGDAISMMEILQIGSRMLAFTKPQTASMLVVHPANTHQVGMTRFHR